MRLNQLFQQFRSDVDDTVANPYLWTDTDLELYFNWALEELAKARYFKDDTTWAALPVTTGDPKVSATSANNLDKLWYIRRAVLADSGDEVTPITMGQANDKAYRDDYGARSFFDSSAWESTTGSPVWLVSDYYEDGSLRLAPIPNTTTTLKLWAFRFPLRFITLESCADSELSRLLGIRRVGHEMTLIQGMKTRAYLKEDPETHDLQSAQTAEVLFRRELDDIMTELTRRRHPAGTVRYGGL